MENNLKFIVEEEGDLERLDKYLALVLPEQSRTYIQSLIKDGLVLVNSAKSKPHHKLKNGDAIEVTLPEPVRLELEPEDIPLEILHEDRSIIVINKKAGMVVHPAAGNFSHTLVNAILFRTKDLSDINGVLRPGIVHRLDKDTSGCIVVAKTNDAHKKLSAQFENREIKKEYIAVVKGVIKDNRGTIDAAISRHPVLRKKMRASVEGREALTNYEVIERFGNATILRIKPETGRTHQIRVHLSHLGHPVLGDAQYAKPHRDQFPFPIPRQMLHAYVLGIRHPETDNYMEFTAPIPQDMEYVFAELRRGKES